MSNEIRKQRCDGGVHNNRKESSLRMIVFFEMRKESFHQKFRSKSNSTQNIIRLSAIILIFCYFAYALQNYTPEQIALHSAIIVSMFSVIGRK